MTKLNSLKASKSSTVKASPVEIVLSSDQLLTIAPVVALANDVYKVSEVYEKASVTLSRVRQSFAQAFCQLMSDSNADYATANAYKKHLFAVVSKAQGVELDTVRKALNKLILADAKEGDYDHTAWLKSESKSAVSNAKVADELAEMSSDEIASKMQALAKSGDFKGASKLQSEVKRREKARATEIARTEAKAITSLKNDVRTFITGADSEQLLAMVYTMNNIATIIKLAKQAK